MFITKTLGLLPKPKILSHNESGVGDVDIADPTKPLEVLIGPVDMNPKDKIELFWGVNIEPVATYTHSPDAPDTNGIFSLYVDTQWIEPGSIEVNYSYLPFPSNTPEFSESTTLIVKLAIPGGRDPDPSSPYQNEALPKPHVQPPGIITSPEGVTATIEPYPNMSQGDKITLSWNGEFITQNIDLQEQVGKLVVIPVPKKIIELAGDSDRLEVRYEIRDIVNNWSRWSLPTHIEVEVGNASLPAPLVPQAPNMVLDVDKLAGSPVQTLVLHYPEIESSDEITLVVERNTAEGVALPPYVANKKVGTSTVFVEFLVPAEQFLPITQGRARLKYTVTKITGTTQRSKSLTLMVIGELPELKQPIVPTAPHGILDPASPQVVALVPPYYFMADGNDVTLVWAGKTASGVNVPHEELKTLTQEAVGKTVEYQIPQEKIKVLAGGSVQLYYTVNTFMRAFFKSPILDLRVSNDSTILLPAPTVDNVSTDGVLDPADIIVEAKVRIHPYTGMAAKDKVTLHWEGRAPDGNFSTYTVINTGTVDREVVFRVQKSVALASLNSQVSAWYEVESGAQKYMSRKQTFFIFENPPPSLPAPHIKEAKGDTISVDDTTMGFTFVVAATADLKINDRVLLRIKTPKEVDSKEAIIRETEAGKEFSIAFTSALISMNVGQSIEAQYDVRRASGKEQTSSVLALTVIGQTQLPAPTLDTVGPDGILTPSKIPESGATVRVGYEGMSSGDSVVVNWLGASAYETPAQVIEANVELQFIVPKSFINQSIGRSATVTYTVTRAGTARVSEPLFLKVAQGLFIDPSPVTLNGKVYLIPGSPDVLPAFPAGTTIQRRALGGQPPYLYRSSNPAVANVDQNGIASSRGNGTATISVTDASGETKSYPLIITGVLHCFGLGEGKYSQITATAASHGGRVPSLNELNEIYNAYGNRWPMGNSIYWSSTLAAQSIIGMKWYFVKNLVTGAGSKILEHSPALGVGIR